MLTALLAATPTCHTMTVRPVPLMLTIAALAAYVIGACILARWTKHISEANPSTPKGDDDA